MSAASFLGISAMVFSSGFDGLLYSLGFMVGWPIVLFLVAERLRNLGKFNLSDVVSFRLAEKPVRTLAAVSSLGCCCILSNCANGGCRSVNQTTIRFELQHCGGDRWSSDDGLCHLRWYVGNNLGTDH